MGTKESINEIHRPFHAHRSQVIIIYRVMTSFSTCASDDASARFLLKGYKFCQQPRSISDTRLHSRAL